MVKNHIRSEMEGKEFDLTPQEISEWSIKTQTIARLQNLHFLTFEYAYGMVGKKKHVYLRHMKALRMLAHAAAYIKMSRQTEC